jgi:hypothetical protein
VNSQPDGGLRALFAIGVTQSFFDADAATAEAVHGALDSAFDGLGERFGATVLGSLADDETQVGDSSGWPWGCYLLAEIPDRAAAVAICDLVRETPVGEARLWKYVKIEARIGGPLFFGRT